MTDQKAIEILEQTIIFWGRCNGKTQYIKAQKLAIKALKNEAKRKELIGEYNIKYQKTRETKYIKGIWALEECEVSDGIKEVGYRDKDDVLVLPKEMDDDWSE